MFGRKSRAFGLKHARRTTYGGTALEVGGPSPCELVNAQELDHHDEDANPEVEIACGFGTESGGQRHATLAESDDKRAFPLEDEIGDIAVARRDQQAEKKSRKFEWHIWRSYAGLGSALNRPKTLVQ